MAHQMKTPAEIAAKFGCTVEQARAQLRANAEGLRRMEAKARASGKKQGGYTAAELKDLADACEQAASQ
jgi:hypothetical protein